VLFISRPVRPPSIFPVLALPLALIVSCLAQASLTGCLAAGASRMSGPPSGPDWSASSTSASPADIMNKQSQEGSESAATSETHVHRLMQKDLEYYLPGLQREAERLGMTAAYILPDENSSAGFLIVAPDTASARQINGYFYWLSGESAAEQDAEPVLLGLDRLFTESGREKAVASGLFSEAGIEQLLEYSLRTVLSGFYQPAMLDFILSCYRADFAARLAKPGQPADQSWSRIFNGIEVDYHASVFSSVLFKMADK
jgi:hypothetical protein